MATAITRADRPLGKVPLAAGLILGAQLSIMQGQPQDPIATCRVLDTAKLKYVLVGGHATNARTGEARATVDVDIIAQFPKKAAKVLIAAYPHLVAEENPVVIRLKDGGNEAVDLIRPESSKLYRRVLKLIELVRVGRTRIPLPTIEANIALKFGAMVSPSRRVPDKYVDARDFILLVERHPKLDMDLLAELGELVYPGGSKEILKLVSDARAGKRLEF